MSLLHPRPAFPRGTPSRAARDRPDGAARAARMPGAAHRPPAAADAAGTPFRVERIDATAAAVHRDAWTDLVGRALEPNVFLDPDFALPAAQHLATGRRPGFVLVWAMAGSERRDLVAVCPVVRRRGLSRTLASAWLHDLATLGFPLLDRERGPAALRALLDWMGREMPEAAGLLVPSLPVNGPTAAALREAATAGGHDVAILDTWERAVLRRGSGLAGLAALSAKGAKEVRRQGRRLAERGRLDYVTSAADDEGLRAAVERFLALEAGGWKGAFGTALLCWPGRTAFARTATRLLVRRGLCRVDSLTLDGKPVAMAVILTAGDADSLWKIAYREDVARFSPGVQLVLAITEAQRRTGGAALTDSCAVPGHPMIDRLWRGRLRLCDLAVATRPGRPAGFRVAVATERAARGLRAGVKRLLRAWRARRPGAVAPQP